MSREIEQFSAAANDVSVDAKFENVSTPTSLASDASESSSAVENKEDCGDFSFLRKSASRVARNPCKHLVVAFIVSIAVSSAGFIFGDFSVSADNTGWLSRGTSIADQTTQLLLLNGYGSKLNENPDLWKDLTTNIQLGFEAEAAGEDQGCQLQNTYTDLANMKDETDLRSGFLGCEASD